MTEHKHAGFLRAIADGEPLDGWEYKAVPHGPWITLNRSLAVAMVERPDIFSTRRKPRIIRIGDMEVPEPLRGAPTMGTEIYLASTTSDMPSRFTWTAEGHLPKLWLKRGLVHTTQEAAEQHRRALILVSGGTP